MRGVHSEVFYGIGPWLLAYPILVAEDAKAVAAKNKRKSGIFS